MLWILASLLMGLILDWFGFDHTMKQGMKEIFDVYITSSGYYFIFGLMGMVKYTLNKTQIVGNPKKEKDKVNVK